MGLNSWSDRGEIATIEERRDALISDIGQQLVIGRHVAHPSRLRRLQHRRQQRGVTG